ncbi:MAG: hypothetical protein CL678_07070 [Bdellovibrionaceae bacterium]|nr:hypothetical protein [Pseudobdellovibrionaceae bacterium]|tara:strand:- start:2773 stop:4155 length:1383 start_codon:yes stop_codon:yes gene_type:complete
MIKVFLFIFFSGTAFGYDFADFQKQIENQGIQDRYEAIDLLPDSIKQSFLLLKKSGGRQRASLAEPRVLFYGDDARFIVTISPQSSSIETIEYKKDDSLEMREISFHPGRPPRFSEKNPRRCLGCHGNHHRAPAHYIWNNYKSWPKVIQGHELESHRSLWKDQPFYSKLHFKKEKGKIQYPTLGPDMHLAMLLAARQYRLLKKEILQSSELKKIKYLTLLQMVSSHSTKRGVNTHCFLKKESIDWSSWIEYLDQNTSKESWNVYRKVINTWDRSKRVMLPLLSLWTPNLGLQDWLLQPTHRVHRNLPQALYFGSEFSRPISPEEDPTCIPGTKPLKCKTERTPEERIEAATQWVSQQVFQRKGFEGHYGYSSGIWDMGDFFIDTLIEASPSLHPFVEFTSLEEAIRRRWPTETESFLMDFGRHRGALFEAMNPLLPGVIVKDSQKFCESLLTQAKEELKE